MRIPAIPPARAAWAAGALCAAGAFAAHGWNVITRMGFYHDDWPLFVILEQGRRAGTGSLAELMAAYPNLLYRPFDALLWAGEHALFGLRPLGWHLTAAALLAATAALTASLARMRGASPRTAAAFALLFLAWPNKDSVQFWPAMTLTMCAAVLWLAAEHARLLYEARGGPARAGACALAFLGCLGFYEQCFFLPLCWLFDPPADALARRRRRRLAALTAAAVALWILVRLSLPRLAGTDYPRPLGFSPSHLAVVLLSMPRAHGPEIFLAALRELKLQLTVAPLGAAAAFALPWLALFLPANGPSSPRKKGSAAYGLALFVLAYAPLALSNYRPVPLGPENRLNFLPALSLALAAAAWWERRPRSAAAWATLLAAAGLLLAASGGTARLWAEASRRQEEVLSAVASRASEWPADRELLLRLPEVLAGGRAPVFASHDSLTFALRLRLDQWDRRADVVMKNTVFLPAGVSRHGVVVPYGSLLLYDAARGTMFLPDGPPPASIR